MTAVTENDLKRLEDLIISRFTAMETRFTAMETRFTAMETRFTAIENSVGEIKTDVKALTEKVDGADKRLTIIETRLDEWKPFVAKTGDLAEKIGELKNWRSIAIAILGAVAGWIARNSMVNNP